MKRHTTLLKIVVALIAVGLLARPDRLWSSPAPELGPGAAALLETLASPALEPADKGAGERVADRAWALAGVTLVEGEIEPGETIDGDLRRAGALGPEALAFTLSLKPVFDPRRARPGDTYKVWLDSEGRILEYLYRRSPVEVYRSQRVEEGWRAEQLEIEIETREAQVAGVLKSSLWESFMEAGADPDLAMSFVDLFSWDVDFAHESRSGDEFRVVYQINYVDGKSIGNGRILAASYRDREELHTAVYWESDETRGYFDQHGNSVRKSFLRSPLSFSRISSRFSYRRKHPITKKVQPHLGIDYAAPVGTPVWSVADGTVQYATRKGANGKMVVIRHARGYETYYLHLSRWARGIRGGTRVEQGQVIGYVGSTGRSTGPHLDYRLKKNGRWVNPLREKFKAGPPVPDEQRGKFDKWSASWQERLDELELKSPTRVAEGEL